MAVSELQVAAFKAEKELKLASLRKEEQAHQLKLEALRQQLEHQAIQSSTTKKQKNEVLANPYYGDKSLEAKLERQEAARRLYDLNLTYLTEIMGSKGMWMVQMSPVGTLDERPRRCKAKNKPGTNCFTVYCNGKGGVPRFGHGNMLSVTNRSIFETMQKDVARIATAKEAAFCAKEQGSDMSKLDAMQAEATVANLEARFGDLVPPSKSAAKKRAKRKKAKERKKKEAARKAELEAVEKEQEESQSFESLLAEIKGSAGGGAGGDHF